MHLDPNWSGQCMAEFWLLLFFLFFFFKRVLFVVLFWGGCFFGYFLTVCFARGLQNPGNESKEPRAPFYSPQPRSMQASCPS